jgi:hypothetical protein
VLWLKLLLHISKRQRYFLTLAELLVDSVVDYRRFCQLDVKSGGEVRTTNPGGGGCRDRAVIDRRVGVGRLVGALFPVLLLLKGLHHNIDGSCEDDFLLRDGLVVCDVLGLLGVTSAAGPRHLALDGWAQLAAPMDGEVLAGERALHLVVGGSRGKRRPLSLRAVPGIRHGNGLGGLLILLVVVVAVVVGEAHVPGWHRRKGILMSADILWCESRLNNGGRGNDARVVLVAGGLHHVSRVLGRLLRPVAPAGVDRRARHGEDMGGSAGGGDVMSECSVRWSARHGK